MSRVVQSPTLSADDTKPEPSKPRFVSRIAVDAAEVVAAQRLRGETFSQEYGVQFGLDGGLDCDDYDAFCDHLNVYDVANARLIATTRVLSAEQAQLVGGFYSGKEFDLSPLLQLSGRVLEVGRTCVHPDYRSGAAIAVLWSGLAEYLNRGGYSYLIGCASISLGDGGTTLASVMPSLREKYFVCDELRVNPNREILLSAPGVGRVSVPPLLKAYLRMGARIGGEACWDPEFNCADVLIFLDLQAMTGRYSQHFMAPTALDVQVK
ncbi:MAG: GNAT family N-acyltransferase [Pseudomonadota bacterium]